MHASFQELLSMRDGAPVEAGVVGHLEGCEECRAELARLAHLKAALQHLAPFEPPPDTYPAVRSSLDEMPVAGRQRRWPALAAALGGVVVFMSVFLWITHSKRGALQAIEPHDLNALVARSQRLEAMLQALPPRPDVEQAATSATIDALQSRIELLDVQLSRSGGGDIAAEAVTRLWNDRVQVLNSLVYVRYAEAAGDGHGAAGSFELGVI